MWFLGIDVGTTHIKVVGVDENGTVLPAARHRTPVDEVDGVGVHSATSIWEATRLLVGRYAAPLTREHGPLGALSVASLGQEESVALDRAGRELCPSPVWWRPVEERVLDPDLARALDSPAHYAVSGIRYRPIQTPERLARLRVDRPDVLARTHRWADFGTVLGGWLTGRWRAAANQVTHSQLFDVRSLAPHRGTAELLDVDPGLFAPVAHTGETVGELLPGALPGVETAPDARVVVGGHDQALAAHAVLRHQPAGVIDSIGTSEYLMTVSDPDTPWERAYDLGVDVERGWDATGVLWGLAVPTGKGLQTLADLLFDGDFDRTLAALAAPATGPCPTVEIPGADPAGLFSLRGVPAGATADAVVRAVADEFARTTLRAAEAMCAIGGTTPADVALVGSLFRRPEMLSHRRAAWPHRLTPVDLDEPVATGAALVARDAVLAAAGTV